MFKEITKKGGDEGWIRRYFLRSQGLPRNTGGGKPKKGSR
jgi:hypothetical protein